MTGPKRRVQRRTHLDAGVVPVEQALLARAEALEEQAGVPAADPGTPAHAYSSSIALIANEFRALAEELHWH
jgi:hypothetical protein